MIKNIWHSAIIMAIIGFAGYILLSNNDCERIDRSVSPVRGFAWTIGWVSRNWLDHSDITGIIETGDDAARHIARGISKTLMSPPTQCLFPDPQPQPRSAPPPASTISRANQ